MSKAIIVLAPNGRRQTINCKADTTFLEVLEIVCEKQGFDPQKYELTHHNKLLDLSNNIRFSNLPNKALVEMVETERQRIDSTVTVALVLENGDRLMGDFSPQTSLHDVLITLMGLHFDDVRNPTIMYMRREVQGQQQLMDTSLRQLGLFQGRAILRLIDMPPEQLRSQANVSSNLPLKPKEVESEVIRIPMSTEEKPKDTVKPDLSPGPSTNKETLKDHSNLNPVNILKANDANKTKSSPVEIKEEMEVEEAKPEQNFQKKPLKSAFETKALNEEQLQRRLTIEQDVTFVGEKKAIVFIPNAEESEIEDLPDDFYELTIEEVRRLYAQLQQQRRQLEEAPLVTASLRATKEEVSISYKHAVIRIQFPDGVILQGVFQPTDTIEDVHKFVKDHITQPNKPFILLTCPSRESWQPQTTLAEARLVPCVLMHFKWAREEATTARCLKPALYDSVTSCSNANILASKYRAPTCKNLQDSAGTSQNTGASTSNTKDNKLLKFLRLK